MWVLPPESPPGSHSKDPGVGRALGLEGFAEPSTFPSLHLQDISCNSQMWGFVVHFWIHSCFLSLKNR